MSRILYQFQMVSQTNKCFYVLTKDAGAISQDSMYPTHNPITAQLSLSSFPRIRAWNRDSRCLQWGKSALRRRGKNTLEQEKAKKCWRTRSETELALVSWARNSGAKTELLLVLLWGKGTSLLHPCVNRYQLRPGLGRHDKSILWITTQTLPFSSELSDEKDINLRADEVIAISEFSDTPADPSSNDLSLIWG